MKTFFKMLLATVLGTFISLFILLLLFLGIVGAMVASGDSKVELKENSILKITLDNPVLDRSPNDPFAGFNFYGFGKEKANGLTEILESIKKAKTDPKVKGIYLEFSVMPIRFATIEEIRNALIDFKKSGKFIIAYADYYMQNAYYLATIADKIYLNPEGSIDFRGLRTEMLFFKGTFDKLGIDVQVFKHGKFKSYPEPYTSKKMSPENKTQITALLNSVWGHAIDGISESRQLTPKRLNILADGLMLVDADSCLANKIVDSLIYREGVFEILLKKSGQKGKEPEFTSINKYENAQGASDDKGYSKEKIAVVYAQGEIVMGDGEDNQMSSNKISEAVRKARIDSTIKAIVLRVNSPGGSSLASEAIWREVVLAKEVKPVVVSMGDVAASGGYYISCPASAIIASPNTITGSIGVFGIIPNVGKFFENKLGITSDVAKTNNHSDFPTIMRAADAQESMVIQYEVDKVYNDFVSRVSKGRKMDPSKVDEIGQGRVWSGIEAMKIGLVDSIGGLNDAIAMAASMAKLKKYRLINLPEIQDPFEKLFKEFTEDSKTKILKEELGENYVLFENFKAISTMKGVQTRMPFELVIY